jgi:D-alanine-D-alanine ligase
MKVAVIHGAVAESAALDEKDVLVQVNVVSEGLAALGHEPVVVPISLNLEEAARTLTSFNPEIAFNLVESISGKGSLIHIVPALLDTLKIPYTGSGTEAIILTSNKILAKKWLGNAGLPTPQWFTAMEIREEQSVSGPWLVKSAWEHASIGLDEDSVVPEADRGGLLAEMEVRRDMLGGACLAEAFIDGREFNVSLLAGDRGLRDTCPFHSVRDSFSCHVEGGQDSGADPLLACGSGAEVLPLAEIRFDGYPPGKVRIVGYRSKWEEGSFEFNHTPRSFEFPETDAPLIMRLKELAIRCWKLFDLKGYARVDFRVDKEGRPWILEVNTNPCLSPDAGFRAATLRAGLTFSEVLKRIIGKAWR